MGTRMETVVSYFPCCDSFLIFTRDDFLVSLCTDGPLPSEKIGERDVCELPSLIVFPFPRNMGESI